jgi:beta-carotene/zeaxanthin 4-ketolase
MATCYSVPVFSYTEFYTLKTDNRIMGLFIAITVYIFWLGHLVFLLLFADVNPTSPLFYIHILVQGYLFTGLFITGHDAMHGTVSKNRKINDLAGWIATLSFAYLSYDRLRKNHYLHHQFPGSEKDPDFYTGSNSFFPWWFKFMVRYTTWWQLVLMAITFNILVIWFSEWRLISFWIIPAFIGNLAAFLFWNLFTSSQASQGRYGNSQSTYLTAKPFTGHGYLLLFWVPPRASRIANYSLVETLYIKK